MGYNVDHVECLSGELTISEEGKAWLWDARNGNLSCWFPANCPEVGHDNTVIMRWSGDCSGYAVDDRDGHSALAKFFSFTRGTAEFVFYWEGGESRSGYRVVDGVITEHEVDVRLGKPVKA